MKRRKFIGTTAMASATSLGASTFRPSEDDAINSEYYEMRRYELAFGGNHSRLFHFLTQSLIPAYRAVGAVNAAVFTEVGDAEPSKIWLMTAFPNLLTYEHSVRITADQAFLEGVTEYAQAGKTYNRFSSFLLKAFDGMPQMNAPENVNSLFELRIYEGKHEDAVRRKIAMFDNEEITLFHKVGLTPVLFGNMLIGPYMPSLVYLLSFPDMEERKAAWQRFMSHPDWNTMKVKEEYADTVSNIRKIFLKLYIP